MNPKKRLAIYIDNSIFLLQSIGGISIVFYKLLSGLKKDIELDLYILVNGSMKINPVFNDMFNSVNILQELRLPKYILPFLPILKVLPKNSVFHSSYNRYSLQKDIKKVITIHDLGYENKVMRQGVKRTIHLFFKKIAIKNADAIICVSQNTLKDLKFYYSEILDGKILAVIYNGISDVFCSTDLQRDTTIPQYALFVGGRQPYKNFEQVIKAVAEIPDYHLYIAGGGGLKCIS